MQDIIKKIYRFKKNKDRIILLPFTNSTGIYKLTLLIIGHYKKLIALRKFKKINPNPYIYNNTQIAWMTIEAFENCFNNNFILEVLEF